MLREEIKVGVRTTDTRYGTGYVWIRGWKTEAEQKIAFACNNCGDTSEVMLEEEVHYSAFPIRGKFCIPCAEIDYLVPLAK